MQCFDEKQLCIWTELWPAASVNNRIQPAVNHMFIYTDDVQTDSVAIDEAVGKFLSDCKATENYQYCTAYVHAFPFGVSDCLELEDLSYSDTEPILYVVSYAQESNKIRVSQNSDIPMFVHLIK